MSKTKSFIALIIVGVSFLFVNVRAYEAQLTVTVVSVPGLSFAELDVPYISALPNIRHMLEHGAVASMNIRTARRSLGDTYAAIAASSYEIGRISQAEQREETGDDGSAVQRYIRYRGNVPPIGQVLLPQSLSSGRNMNEGSMLGETLRLHGVDTVVYGNADLGKETMRYASLMLAGSDGAVRYGNVGNDTLTADFTRAYGIKTDYANLLKLWSAVSAPAVVVLELGDLHRLYEQQAFYEEAVFEASKLEVLREIDAFIGALRSGLPGQGSELWLMSPLVNRDAWQARNRLAPLVKLSSGTESSVLYSHTTRRDGVISMYDLAPSLLASFGITAPAGRLGLPVEEKSVAHAFAELQQRLDKMITVYRLRPELLYPFVTYQAVVLVAALVTLLLQLTAWRHVIRFALFTLLTAPLVLLLIALPTIFGIDRPALVAVFLAMQTALAWVCMRFSMLLGLIFAAGSTALVLLVDGLLGFPMVQSSVLGYDPMIGARYYGIGNEYMGVWIGAALLLASVVWHLGRSGGRKKLAVIKVLTCALFAAIFICLALPGVGSNAGGALTAGVAFGWFGLRMLSANSPKGFGAVKMLIMCGGMLLAALLLLWLLNAFISAQSHIGRALDLIYAGRFDAIITIIARKLAMNAHLIGVSVWTKALLASLLVITVIMLKPGRRFRRWQERYPELMHGFSANAAGGIVALAANDSGIVAAATMIVFMVVPMLLLRSSEMEESYDSASSPQAS